VEFAFSANETVALLVLKGDVVINGGETARSDDFVVFRKVGEQLSLEAASDAQFLVLNGEPIGEPIVQYGPFVMNTKREIEQAVVDFNRGKFGHLDD
jgi:redox-sensitive bicupin YhaK (pirin superfamily)